MLQIDMLLDRRPKDLSGGQRQRVAIGRAVVREPTIFLFDEPLSNLDAELRVDMRGEISALHKRLGNTMIYVTHDQVEAMTMADKIAVLRLGELEQFGRPLDLFNAPENLFVAGFIGSPKMNFLKGIVGEDRTLPDARHRRSRHPAGDRLRPASRPEGHAGPAPQRLAPRRHRRAPCRDPRHRATGLRKLPLRPFRRRHAVDGPQSRPDPPATGRTRGPHREFRRHPPLRHGNHPQPADVTPSSFRQYARGARGTASPDRPTRAPEGGARRTVRPQGMAIRRGLPQGARGGRFTPQGTSDPRLAE
jgi:hypothetical protein